MWIRIWRKRQRVRWNCPVRMQSVLVSLQWRVVFLVSRSSDISSSWVIWDNSSWQYINATVQREEAGKRKKQTNPEQNCSHDWRLMPENACIRPLSLFHALRCLRSFMLHNFIPHKTSRVTLQQINSNHSIITSFKSGTQNMHSLAALFIGDSTSPVNRYASQDESHANLMSSYINRLRLKFDTFVRVSIKCC